MDERLAQALDNVAFTSEHLRAALAEAGAVEALILLPLIERCAKLRSDIQALLAARKAA